MQARIIQFNIHFGEFWIKCKGWIIFLIVAFLFDTLTTIHFMTIGNIDLELHPLVRYSAIIMGPVAGTIVSAFCYRSIVSICLALYLKRWRLWVLTLPAITSTLAGFYNLYTTELLMIYYSM